MNIYHDEAIDYIGRAELVAFPCHSSFCGKNELTFDKFNPFFTWMKTQPGLYDMVTEIVYRQINEHLRAFYGFVPFEYRGKLLGIYHHKAQWFGRPQCHYILDSALELADWLEANGVKDCVIDYPRSPKHRGPTHGEVNRMLSVLPDTVSVMRRYEVAPERDVIFGVD